MKLKRQIELYNTISKIHKRIDTVLLIKICQKYISLCFPAIYISKFKNHIMHHSIFKQTINSISSLIKI